MTVILRHDASNNWVDRLFVQHLVEAHTKKDMKAPTHYTLREESTGNRGNVISIQILVFHDTWKTHQIRHRWFSAKLQ